MKLSLALCSTIIAIASATNIKNHFKDNCRGGYLSHPNIAPRVCASALRNHNTAGAVSIAFSQMPQHSGIYGWQATRDKGTCGSLAKKGNVGNTDHHCMTKLFGGAQYAGSSWSQPSRKRDSDDDVSCTSETAPESLVLDDGHMYRLKGMDENNFNELYELAVKGTSAKDLPSKFATFEVEKDRVEARVQEMNA